MKVVLSPLQIGCIFVSLLLLLCVLHVSHQDFKYPILIFEMFWITWIFSLKSMSKNWATTKLTFWSSAWKDFKKAFILKVKKKRKMNYQNLSPKWFCYILSCISLWIFPCCQCCPKVFLWLFLEKTHLNFQTQKHIRIIPSSELVKLRI